MTSQQLRESGKRAREIVLSTNPKSLDAWQRVLRSAIKDLLPSQANIHGAVLEGCILLLKTEINFGDNYFKAAAISTIRSQLSLSYNNQTVIEAVLFAEGFLGIDSRYPSLEEGKAQKTPVQIESWERSSSTFTETELYGFVSRTETPEVKIQASQKFIVVGSFLMATVAVTLLGVTTLKVLDASNGADKSNRQESGNNSRHENIPSPGNGIKNISPTSNVVPQSQSSMEHIGYAVGGQKLQLDLASIKAYPNRENISFRYALGKENIDSIADCRRKEWMTLPEKEWHSPQSAATHEMLSRVCEELRSDAPAISRSGVAIVFDPPSNVRITPNGGILCSITSRGTIPIQGKRGDWYETDYCGTTGYIHKGQVKF